MHCMLRYKYKANSACLFSFAELVEGDCVYNLFWDLIELSSLNLSSRHENRTVGMGGYIHGWEKVSCAYGTGSLRSSNN